MRDELHKYYIPKTFIKQELRYNFLLGFLVGIGLSIVIGMVSWAILYF